MICRQRTKGTRSTVRKKFFHSNDVMPSFVLRNSTIMKKLFYSVFSLYTQHYIWYLVPNKEITRIVGTSRLFLLYIDGLRRLAAVYRVYCSLMHVKPSPCSSSSYVGKEITGLKRPHANVSANVNCHISSVS
jgi:hypothetical protein